MNRLFLFFFTVTVTFSLQDVVICSCAPLVLRRFCSPITGLLSPDKRGRYGGGNESIEPRGV